MSDAPDASAAPSVPDAPDASAATAADVVRAWRDPLFRASLDELARAALPAHPAGDIEVPGLDRD
ncbi:mersacidin/lichenicidin family type 2 lantibiotic [Streptomyces sp. NPDC006544]|uniref:mersacidin/lichenicidin family type 2 lantibiotic n=1 Tax=Streptomyces sp. NPDC006544 TaxID=3154583 RepID=UPI0033A22EF8